jgi:hypothetical protein
MRATLALAAGLCLAFPLSASAQETSPTPEGSAQQSSTTAGPSGPMVHKYCSVYVPGNWRAHFWVGDSWTAAECADLGARGLGANNFQLFCQSDAGNWSSGTSWSGNNPGTQQLPINGNQCNWALQ